NQFSFPESPASPTISPPADPQRSLSHRIPRVMTRHPRHLPTIFVLLSLWILSASPEVIQAANAEATGEADLVKEVEGLDRRLKWIEGILALDSGVACEPPAPVPG
ncbi:MAG: hypothetical protein KDM64_16385, partial [Verrucomicrobiae bacterium]|nr:hypothetical protein [Verrucomicrobiae bacterium]